MIGVNDSLILMIDRLKLSNSDNQFHNELIVSDWTGSKIILVNNLMPEKVWCWIKYITYSCSAQGILFHTT